MGVEDEGGGGDMGNGVWEVEDGGGEMSLGETWTHGGWERGWGSDIREEMGDGVKEQVQDGGGEMRLGSNWRWGEEQVQDGGGEVRLGRDGDGVRSRYPSPLPPTLVVNLPPHTPAWYT